MRQYYEEGTQSSSAEPFSSLGNLKEQIADTPRAGSQTQKGITTYAISANRQRPMAGTLNAAVFNSWRRFRAQALYVIPPFAVAYMLIDWAVGK
jgi:ubiquinol-cytochrome c reductase subunit 8